jgi:dTMP kinase
MYILIEGPDGVGKGTLIDTLVEKLSKNNDVVSYIDPGISTEPEWAEWQILRNFVKYNEMDSFTEMLLFYTVRSRLMQEVDRSLSEGKIVIQDRGSLSTMVYQGIIKGCDVKALDDFCDFTKPDITLILDAPFDILTERLQKRAANIDKFKSNDDFRQQVWQAYSELYNSPTLREQYSIVNIDATLPAEQVFYNCLEEIINAADKYHIPIK